MTRGDTAPCEFCGVEFDDEPALYDHWFRADPERHDLDDEQRQAMIDEQVRQTEANEVRADITVEIPRENWEWAVDQYDLADPNSDELPDPNDSPNQAIELVDARYHYEVVDSDSNPSSTSVHDRKFVIGIIGRCQPLRHAPTSTCKAE